MRERERRQTNRQRQRERKKIEKEGMKNKNKKASKGIKFQTHKLPINRIPDDKILTTPATDRDPKAQRQRQQQMNSF